MKKRIRTLDDEIEEHYIEEAKNNMSKSQKTKVELKFKVSNALTLSRWLSQLPLQGQASRKRSQFVSRLQPVVQLADDERVKLLKSFAKKNEKGEPETFVDENQVEKYDISEEDEKKFNTDMNAYLAREYSLNLAGDDVSLFHYVAKIVIDTDFKFSGQMANEYNDWCEAIENA